MNNDPQKASTRASTLPPYETIPPLPPYEAVLEQDTLPQWPPIARSPPRSPPRRIESPLRTTLQTQTPPRLSTAAGSGLLGPRPLMPRYDSSDEKSAFLTDSQRVSDTTTRPAPPRTWPSRDESRRTSGESELFDLEAFKWRTMQDWETYGRAEGKKLNFSTITRSFQRCNDWSSRKKLIVFGSLAGFILILIIIIAAASSKRSSSSTDQDLSSIHVTNPKAFTNGGAIHDPMANITNAAIGKDEYTYYTGTAKNFPPSSSWITFDAMWNHNQPIIINSCTKLGYSPVNSASDISNIHAAIQHQANVTLVDPRFILATILQESHGCVSVGSTMSFEGITNPGLMQSHNGTSYDPAHPKQSVFEMVRDGTQGTAYGVGLVQNLNKYGNLYEAARGYNSGSIAKSGDLSDANGATACYVSDIANRLTGWVKTASGCPNEY